MPDPNYEYRGLIASNWDLLRGDTSEWDDRFFFLDVVRESGPPVLDVGCGTGRLLPGGALAMPFMVLWTEPSTEKIVRKDWDQDYGGMPRRKIRPEDGAEVGVHGRAVGTQLRHN